MGATTTRKSSSNGNGKTEPSNSEQRDALIAQYHAFDAAAKAATEKGDKKAAATANAKKSNLSHSISNLETELEIEGVEFEPFVKPRASRPSRPSVSQEQIVADVEKLGKVLATTQKPTVKANANQRITALLKQAEKAGYKVKDPRK